ncbi:MAG: hypothetical protein QOJ92_1221 [Frankiales bacterium]|jgi:hypothetical protein|nr:hypothetical protein [Frankiales bacterium]MDX6274011.1 hypothetical protein [Frankiales bacterium]
MNDVREAEFELDRCVELRGMLRFAIDSQDDPWGAREDVPTAVREVCESLRELEPGVQFSALLVELGHVVGDDLFTREALLSAWDRQRAWSLAQFYAAAQPFTDEDKDKEWSDTESIRHSLGLSRHGARNVALVARRLFTLFPDTLDQLRTGRITQGHVWALIETTRDLEDEDAGKVEQLTFHDAPDQTVAEYRRALDRARMVVSPANAEKRQEEKVRGRRVSKWTSRDGVGKLLAELPAEDLAAAWDALLGRAKNIKNEDDPRAQGALLADALVECITGHPAANDPRRRPDTPKTHDDWPEDEGEKAEEQKGASTPSAGEPASDDAGPSKDVVAAVEVHVVVPVGRLVPGSPALILPLANRAARRAARVLRRMMGGRRGRVLTSQSVAVVGLDTFMGRALMPGELTGAGWVPSSVIHRLLQGDVLIRRLVVDESGRLLDGELTIPLPAGELPSPATEEALLAMPFRERPLDYGASVYRMPAELERFIVLRDRTCTIPGCGQPAWRCDCDHAVPFPRGATSAANCGSLCRWHHRLKTLADWDLDRLEDGSVLWTSPAGHVRRRPAFSYSRYLS